MLKKIKVLSIFSFLYLFVFTYTNSSAFSPTSEVKKNNCSISSPSNKQKMILPQTSESDCLPPTYKDTSTTSASLTSWNNQLTTSFQKALTENSFWIYPILLLAGFLMNLTPCVYPMIPITIGVFSHFQKNNSQNKKTMSQRLIFPLCYVSGMVVTYSFLGVLAASTGHVFGSQLSHPWFQLFIGGILILMGLSMLGFFQMSFLQKIAYKVPLFEKKPLLASTIMGAVSGLVAAPCTGPILGVLLLLIAQEQAPLSGFIDMLFFSIGFGLPYLILGFAKEKFFVMPKFGPLNLIIKLVFSSLIFSLSFYFLKNILLNFEFLWFLFSRPSLPIAAVIAFFELLFLSLIFIQKKSIFIKINSIAFFLCSFIISLWITIGISNSFVGESLQQQKAPSPSLIHWVFDWKEAQALSIAQSKPIFVDIWAQWCEACLKMEETTWNDPLVANFLNEKFIPFKIDYSNPDKDQQENLNNWGVVGLPAFVVFASAESYPNHPQQIKEGALTEKEFLWVFSQKPLP